MENEYALTDLSMDDRRRGLKGSAALDLFKRLHKTELARWHFATDSDLWLIEKNPHGVVALLDIKCGNDGVTFAEVILYNEISRHTCPVYIVTAHDESAIHAGIFLIERYLGGDPGPQPPRLKLGQGELIIGWPQLEEWETARRAEFKRRASGKS